MNDLHELIWLTASESVLFASAVVLATFTALALVTAFARAILD